MFTSVLELLTEHLCKYVIINIMSVGAQVKITPVVQGKL